jgi:uncharacterized membrane protein
MNDWTNKQWGAVIGALVLFSMFLIGFSATIAVVLFGILGYFIGKFLDGELDLEDIRDRAQRRYRAQRLR